MEYDNIEYGVLIVANIYPIKYVIPDLKSHGQSLNILIFPVFLGVLHYH